MSAIGPGDWLECVDASPFEGRLSPLTVGDHYQIERVHDFLPHLGNAETDWFDCGVELVGVPGPRVDLAWGLYRFRPIGGLDFIEQLKQPAPPLAEPVCVTG